MKKANSAHGFTLTELLIGTLVAAVLGLVVATMFGILSGRFVDVSDRLEAEIVAARAESLFRTYLSSAVDLGLTAPVQASESFTIASSTGWMRNSFVYDQIADMATNWSTIAVFWREDGRPEAGSPLAYGGLLRKTAIWYRKPSRTTSGTIFFGAGPDPVTNPAGTFTPTFQDPYIDRVTYLSINKNIANPSFDKVGNVEVTLRIRYHTSHDTGRNWCPTLDITANAFGCGAVIENYKDIEKTFSILLQNNLIKSEGLRTTNSPTQHEERVMSNIYFFKMVNPVQ